MVTSKDTLESLEDYIMSSHGCFWTSRPSPYGFDELTVRLETTIFEVRLSSSIRISMLIIQNAG